MEENNEDYRQQTIYDNIGMLMDYSERNLRFYNKGMDSKEQLFERLANMGKYLTEKFANGKDGYEWSKLEKEDNDNLKLQSFTDIMSVMLQFYDLDVTNRDGCIII